MAIAHIRSAAGRLGNIGFGGSGTLSFDGTGCDLLVVCLSWADVTAGQPPPYVTYAGVPAQQLRSPRGFDASSGYAALYLVRSPASGSHALTVDGTQFLGIADVAVIGLSGTSGESGATATKVMPAVAADAIALANVAAGSRSIGFVAHRYGAIPDAVTAAGWTQRASATSTADGVNSSIWAFDGTAAGTVAFDIDAGTTAIAAHLIAVELYEAGYVSPDSTTTVVGAKVDCLGAVAAFTTAQSFFDPVGADWLVVCLAAGSTGLTPIMIYEGQPLTLQPLVLATADVGSMWWAAVPAPGSGTRTIEVTGQTGWFGATTVMWIALNGTAGALVGSATAAAAGVGLSTVVGGGGGGRMLAFAVAEYTDVADIAVNAEWTRHAFDTDQAEPRAAGWVFSARAGSGQTFEAVFSDYANLQVLIVNLRGDLTATPDIAGSGTLALPGLAEISAGTAVATLPPAGQKLGVYWESFFDIPAKPDPQPSDFHLAHIPGHIDQVYLSFGEPQCTYTGLTDNVLATTRLRFDYPASLLKAIVASVKARHPHIAFYVAIQQFTPEGAFANEPYDPTGWAGMTATHVAAWRKFCDDIGLAGVIVDYEVLSQLSGFGVTIGGPLVSGNTISVSFSGHYARYPIDHGGYYDPLELGPGTIPYSVTASKTFSGSSDATMLALASDLNAALVAAGVPQGKAYCDTGSGIAKLRIVYNFCVVDVSVGGSITGGATQASIGQADNSFDYHCQSDAAGRRYCWTDAEMKSVIDLLRAGLPRPGYEIWLDLFSTGLYGEAPFDRVDPPLGYNHGYDLWLARPVNAATAAKLDGIHLMSYDVGDGYDPRQALEAAQYWLPTLPVKLGLRVGPPDYAGVKQTVADMLDYANHTIVRGAYGAMVYALMWDSVDQRADFSLDHPDINYCTWAVAQRYGHTVTQRTIGRLVTPIAPTVRP